MCGCFVNLYHSCSRPSFLTTIGTKSNQSFKAEGGPLTQKEKKLNSVPSKNGSMKRMVQLIVGRVSEFDCIRSSTSHFYIVRLIPDAEVIFVASEIISNFPVLSARKYTLRINHVMALKSILKHCGLEESQHKLALNAILISDGLSKSQVRKWRDLLN